MTRRSVQGWIIRCGSEHSVPRNESPHDVEPKIWQTIQFQQRRIGVLNHPRFLLHLVFELTGSPACIAHKRANCKQIFLPLVARFVQRNVVIEFQTCALLPFKRRKHQLIFSDRTSQKHRHISEFRRWRARHQFGHWSIKRAIIRHFLMNFGTAKNLNKLCKILLLAGGTSLSSLKFSYNCSGGNSRPSRLSGVGGGNFLQTKVCLFLFALARNHAPARLPLEKKRSTLKVKHPMSNSAKSQRVSWPIVFTVVALIVAITTVIIFLRVESWPARTARQSTAALEKLGKNLGAVFVDIAHLQPRIIINNRIYMEQTAPVSELIVLSRRIDVEHEFLHTWVGSSKRVKLHGNFIAKAGFDLQKGLSIDVGPEQITVQLPHAQVLGVEQQQLDVLAFENGLWNRISAQNLQSELSVLPQLAWKKAVETGLPGEAEQRLQRQLEERIHTAQPLRLVFKDSPEKSRSE